MNGAKGKLCHSLAGDDHASSAATTHILERYSR